MLILKFQKSELFLRWSRAHKNGLFLNFFILMKNKPLPRPKNDLIKIRTIGYGYRHVMRVHNVQVLELKPHI